jgi:hypothetical protein
MLESLEDQRELVAGWMPARGERVLGFSLSELRACLRVLAS